MPAPSAGRGFGFGRQGGAPAAATPHRSAGRFPDGADTDSNCEDFLLQSTSSLALAADAGATIVNVVSVADFVAGQTVILDAGANRESVVIAAVGTAGGTTVGTATDEGATVIPVAGAAGFNAGQTITIDSGANRETVVVASVASGRRRPGGGPGGAAITVTAPLRLAHAEGAQVTGTGITLAAALTRAHDGGTQLAASLPTPGAPNQYARSSP